MTNQITISGATVDVQKFLEEINKLNNLSNMEIDYGNDEALICSYCHNEIDLTELTAAEKPQVLATKLCKNCQNILQQAASILNTSIPHKKVTKSQALNFIQSQPKKISAGKQCRALIFQAMPNITQKYMDMFCDEYQSKELFGILYPLFIKITGMTDVQIDNARKVRGFYRYFAKQYHILNNDYLMCNDLYERHIARFNNTLIDLKLINGEKIDIPERRRQNSLSEASSNIKTFNIDSDLSAEEIIQQGLTLPEKQRVQKRDLIDIVAFNKADNIEIIQRPKKTKEEILQDVTEIEHQQQVKKKERLSKIKAKFNFSTKHLPEKRK